MNLRRPFIKAVISNRNVKAHVAETPETDPRGDDE